MADIIISISDGLMDVLRRYLTRDCLNQMSENAMHAIRSEEADRWVTEFKCAENEDRVFIVRVIEHSPLRWYFSLDSRTSSPEVTAGISIGHSFSDAFFR